MCHDCIGSWLREETSNGWLVDVYHGWSSNIYKYERTIFSQGSQHEPIVTKRGSFTTLDYSVGKLPDNAFVGAWDHVDWTCFPGTGFCTRMYR